MLLMHAQRVKTGRGEVYQHALIRFWSMTALVAQSVFQVCYIIRHAPTVCYLINVYWQGTVLAASVLSSSFHQVRVRHIFLVSSLLAIWHMWSGLLHLRNPTVYIKCTRYLGVATTSATFLQMLLRCATFVGAATYFQFVMAIFLVTVQVVLP